MRTGDGAVGLVLDSHGLSEAARGEDTVRSLVRRAVTAGAPVVVSAATLAEVLRGAARDASVHFLLKGLRVQAVTAEVGRSAGELLGRTGRSDAIDAIVVATADLLPRPVVVVTSDPKDIGALAAELAGVRVRAV